MFSDKIKKVLIGIVSFGSVVVFVAFLIPIQTEIEKTLLCNDPTSGEKVLVEIKGTYYKYLFGDDEFRGSIIIEGKREANQRFSFIDDRYSNFNDVYGQPEGSILQYDMFQYISISEQGYQISSEWK